MQEFGLSYWVTFYIHWCRCVSETLFPFNILIRTFIYQDITCQKIHSIREKSNYKCSTHDNKFRSNRNLLLQQLWQASHLMSLLSFYELVLLWWSIITHYVFPIPHPSLFIFLLLLTNHTVSSCSAAHGRSIKNKNSLLKCQYFIFVLVQKERYNGSQQSSAVWYFMGWYGL